MVQLKRVNVLIGKDLSVEDRPMAYQLVGSVMDYQGYDE